MSPFGREHNFFGPRQLHPAFLAGSNARAAIGRMHPSTRHYHRRALPLGSLHRALLPSHRMPIGLPRDAHLPPVSADNIENALNVARGIGTVIPVTAPYFAAIQAIEHIPTVGPIVKTIGEAPIRATVAAVSAIADAVGSLAGSGSYSDAQMAATIKSQLAAEAAQVQAGNISSGGGGRVQEF